MNSIFIVEDHPVMRKGLAVWFAGTGRWLVTGVAENLDAAQEAVSGMASLPDIILIDIQLKNEQSKETCASTHTDGCPSVYADGCPSAYADGLGLDFIPWLKKKYGKKTPALAVYTQFDDYAHAALALSFGIQAYVCKFRSEEELEVALLAALEGECFIDPAVQSKVQRVDTARKLLTPREAQLLTLVKEGLSNKTIAEKLNIRVRTVENILSCIYTKTGISSRIDLQRM